MKKQNGFLILVVVMSFHGLLHGGYSRWRSLPGKIQTSMRGLGQSRFFPLKYEEGKGWSFKQLPSPITSRLGAFSLLKRQTPVCSLREQLQKQLPYILSSQTVHDDVLRKIIKEKDINYIEGLMNENMVTNKDLDVVKALIERDMPLDVTNDDNLNLAMVIAKYYFKVDEYARDQYNVLLRNMVERLIAKGEQFNWNQRDRDGYSLFYYLAENFYIPADIVDKVSALPYLEITAHERLELLTKATTYADDVLLHRAVQGLNTAQQARLINMKSILGSALENVMRLVAPKRKHSSLSSQKMYEKEARERMAIELIVRGARIDTLDSDGGAPLMQAINNDYINIIPNMLVIVQNPGRMDNLNIRDKNGDTALHYAARKSEWNLMHLLVKHGVNPRLKNNEGFTAIDILTDPQEKQKAQQAVEQGVVAQPWNMRWLAPLNVKR